ncbi:MAG: HlyD family efflux transporter periplasmic adaptor subunit [Candidatus Hydrogenedentes bacterium]|nr:HlyD family efflux transporter periplasmic adaptor subunit [Candidatus Hydrogenedentota bacterium]
MTESSRITVVAAMGLCFWAGCWGNDPNVLRVSGQIEGVGVDVGSRVGGRVREVLVAEGDRVAAGDTLVRIEDDEALAQVAAAQAQYDQAAAVLAKLEAGARPEELEQAEAAARRAEQQYRLVEIGLRTQEIEAAKAAVDAARAQRDEARAEFKRLDPLFQQKVVSRQLYDKAKHALEAAAAQLEAAQKKADIAVQGSREEEIAIARAAYEQAQAALDLVRNGARAEDVAAARAAANAALAGLRRAETTAREMVVQAPRDGVVESLDVHPGDLVKPGSFVRIADPEDLELVIYVSAAALGQLRVGQKVRLTADSLGDEAFEAVIVQIASQGEYTPRNLQTEEERVQQMFGIKLTLNSTGGKLKAGMTATAHLDLRQEQ